MSLAQPVSIMPLFTYALTPAGAGNVRTMPYEVHEPVIPERMAYTRNREAPAIRSSESCLF